MSPKITRLETALFALWSRFALGKRHKIPLCSFVLQKLAPALLESDLLSLKTYKPFSVNTANKVHYFFMRLQTIALRLLTTR